MLSTPARDDRAACAYARDALLGIFQQRGRRVAQVGRAFGEDDTALQQEAAYWVDHRSATMHQPVANAVQGLQIELIVGLDRHAAHVLTRYSLGDCLCIDTVVLVRFHEGLHELCRYQPDVMALIAQSRTDEMCPGTGFDAN